MENNDFIQVHIKKYYDLIDQMKSYERSLINIYHYARFRDEPVELIVEELDYILGKYYADK